MCGYINSLPGEILHLVFDVYSKDIAYSLPSKGRNDDGQFRHVSDLTQKLPSPSCWKVFYVTSKIRDSSLRISLSIIYCLK